MDPFIFGNRHGISIINLEATQAQLLKVLPVLEDVVAQGKTILFLATKRQAQKLVKDTAESLGMPYIVERWIGGLLTNYSSVSGLMRKLTELKEGRDNGEWEKRYNKKERLVLEREVQRLDRIVGGIENMEKIPDAIFVVDCGKESTAVREANRRNIPVFAIVDSNVNPDKVQYAIPANDDGIKSIKLILDIVAEVIKRGQVRQKEMAAAKAAEAPTAEAAKTEKPESKPTTK